MRGIGSFGIRIWVFGLLLFSAFPPIVPSLFSAEIKDLNKNWIDRPEDFSENTFGLILELMREDSELSDSSDSQRSGGRPGLLKSVRDRLHASDAQDLVTIIRICTDMKYLGLTSRPTRRGEAALPPPGERANWSKEILDEMSRSVEVSESERTPGDASVEVRWFSYPEICVYGIGRSQLDAFLTFVHEFTHIDGFRPFSKCDENKGRSNDVLEYRDGYDYAEMEVKAEGGELEAFTAQMRALKRLKKRALARGQEVHYHLGDEDYFDSDGNLKNRQGYIEYILEKRGYRSILNSDFQKMVLAQKNSVQGSLSYHETLKTITQKNLEITTQNIEISEHNLNIAIAERKAEGEKYRSQEKFYREYLQKIDVKIESLKKQVKAIEDKFPAVFKTAF